MVLDDFGSGIGLVWIIGLSLLVNYFILCGATTLVLCGTTTLVLCGATTVVLFGRHHPLWLSFHLIYWFGLWLGFGLSYGDIFGLYKIVRQSFGSSGFSIYFPLLMN
jgi:hypothetical protein